jgi:hypothetical protein
MARPVGPYTIKRIWSTNTHKCDCVEWQIASHATTTRNVLIQYTKKYNKTQKAQSPLRETTQTQSQTNDEFTLQPKHNTIRNHVIHNDRW